jgi:biotin carboxyl carrier protein
MARYMVTIEGREFEIEVESHGDYYIARDGSKDATVTATHLSETRSLMHIDGTPLELDIIGNGYDRSRSVLMKAIEFSAEIEDYQLAKLRRTAALAGGGAIETTIRAPMPGLVLDIKVAPGDKVLKNQPLVIIEAMKMENLIKAQGDAVVKAVHVSPKQSVEKNDKLLELE